MIFFFCKSCFKHFFKVEFIYVHLSELIVRETAIDQKTLNVDCPYQMDK